MPKDRDLNKKNKGDDVLGGGRTSLYFAPSEDDLLQFVNSQDVKRNKFIINLIRAEYERQKSQQMPKVEVNEVSNEDLLKEIKSLKSFIENHSFKIEDSKEKDTVEEIEEVEQPNVLPVADDSALISQNYDDVDDL